MAITVRMGTKVSKSKKAIIECDTGQYTIYVFKGDISKYDILIKYNKKGGTLRTPKHIHWVTDMLMKMQADKPLTQEFLKEIQTNWEGATGLENNDYETLKELVTDYAADLNLSKYCGLNSYGEYDVEFLYTLLDLLATQEKTNNPNAYMFGNIIKALLDDNLDIFKIVSTAGFRGR